MNTILKIFFSIPFFFNIETYPLPLPLEFEDIFFKNEYIYFVGSEYVRGFNTEQRKFLLPISKPINSTVGIYGNSFLICEYVNYQISNPDEYSTEIFIYERGDVENLTKLQFNQTVKPVNCSKERLLLETSIPQLEKKFFAYDYESEKLEEILGTPAKNQYVWENDLGSILVKKDVGDIVWIYRKVLKF